MITILFVASTLAFADARVVPAAVSPKASLESVDRSLNELKIIEMGRQEALKKALGNPKLKADYMIEFLSVLSMMDSLFTEHRKYYDAMNKLIHSDAKSTAAQEALATIKSSRERSIKLNEAIDASSGKLNLPSTSMDSQLRDLQNLYEKTLEKGDEIEAELHIAFDKSPLKKLMKKMPDISDES
nr:PREDICTED: uncharacterized protein LOC109035876 [Bemisia tabaci]